MADEHYNDCPRCPRVRGHSWIEEIFHWRGISFDVWIANKLIERSMLKEVSHASLEKWVSHTAINEEHVSHLPEYSPPGIAVTMPDEIVLIDGNHRAARALRDGRQFIVYLLPVDLTEELIQRTAERTQPSANPNQEKDNHEH